MKKKLAIFVVTLLMLFPMTGCQKETIVTLDPETVTINREYDTRIVINDYQVKVNEETTFNIWFSNDSEAVTYTYDKGGIRIENGVIRGLKAGTTTKVTATTASGLKTTFEVSVENDTYVSTHADEVSEGWFTPFSDETIESLKVDTLTANRDFPLGIDISMVEQVEEMGGKYYNSQGVRQNVYDILKDNGVNYVRIRLFNDPYNRDEDGKVLWSYGAGTNDLDNVTRMASEAKKAGLQFLLDFHYSDFWAHPGQQVMPKAWASLSTSDEIASKLSEYTTQVLQHLKDNGAEPDMVQVGNEINSGLLLQSPGAVDTKEGSGNPKYISGSASLISSIRGANGKDYDNMTKYVNAGLKAVKDFNEDIMTAVHYAGRSISSTFIDSFNHDYLDVVGISAYTFYHGRISDVKSSLTAIAESYPNLKFMIAETSAPYTYAKSAYASHEIGSDDSYKYNSYAATVEGQAKTMRDLIEAVASLENGYGIFCWEGAWLPVSGAGWAGGQSQATWANQAFFSYDGKALPSLSVFNYVWNTAA